jgi:hypothetical protein
MATPPEKPTPRINPLFEDDDYRVAPKPVEQRAVPEYVAKHLRPAEKTPKSVAGAKRTSASPEKRVSAAEELPLPPRWPMLTGVLAFPFYLKSLEVLVYASIGLMVSGWLFMFWVAYGAFGGPQTVYYLGLPACAAITLTFGYLTTCCLTIIESTAAGWDSFDISPGIDWKEWTWNLTHVLALVAQAGLAGYAVQLLAPTRSWLPMIAVTYAVFPVVLLGALAADGAWLPLAIGAVLRSMVQKSWAWALFYFEMTPMVVAWSYITVTQLSGRAPWLTPLYSAPLLAIIVLIYARLIGRLAACVLSSQKSLSQGDDDES